MQNDLAAQQLITVSDSLLTAVFERGVPESLNSRDKLKAFLENSFHGHSSNPFLKRMFITLSVGLQRGPPYINARVKNGEIEEGPVLQFLCGFTELNRKCGCRLSHSLVDLVLRAGADASAVFSDSTNSLMCAALEKARGAATFNLLLEAKANIHHRDQEGRSCLYYALLGRPAHPPTIRRILEHLPAMEMIPLSGNGHTYQASCVDVLLLQAVCLGEPPDDTCECIMLLCQHGARFTLACSDALNLMGLSFTNPADERLRKRGGYISSAQELPAVVRSIQGLTKALMGLAIPPAFRSHANETVRDETDGDRLSMESTCSLCHSLFTKPITLYCDHTFCLQCIIDYGKRERSDSMIAVPQRCPVCPALLCRDLLPSFSTGISISERLQFGLTGPVERMDQSHFTQEQVIAEAKAQGIYSTALSLDSLRFGVQNALFGVSSGNEETSEDLPAQVLRSITREPVGPMKVVVDLSLSVSVEHPGDSRKNILPKLILAPSCGAVSIVVAVNGTPLLGRIANRCMYTIFSKAVVDALGLTRVEALTSLHFKSTVTGKTAKKLKFTCLDPVKISVAGTEVVLRNAVEVTDPPTDMFGVQLGQDFLYSGRLAVIDVAVGDADENGRRRFYRTVGDVSKPVEGFSGISKDESFRFYSHDGGIAHLPLLRLQPYPKDLLFGYTLPQNSQFHECSWCCRMFPRLHGCVDCDGLGEDCKYCDKRCQVAAWKIHKRTRCRAHT